MQNIMHFYAHNYKKDKYRNKIYFFNNNFNINQIICQKYLNYLNNQNYF